METLNRYAYASSNPISHVDPTGMFDWSTHMVESGDTLACIAREAGKMQPGEYRPSVISEAVNYHNIHRGSDRFVDHPAIDPNNPNRLLAAYQLALPPSWQRIPGICNCPASTSRGECDIYTPPLPGDFLPPGNCPPSNVEEPTTSSPTTPSLPPVRCAEGYVRRGNQCVAPLGTLVSTTNDGIEQEIAITILEWISGFLDVGSALNSSAGVVLTLLGTGLGCAFGGGIQGCLAGFAASYLVWEATDHLNDGAAWIAFMAAIGADILEGDTRIDWYLSIQTGQLSQVFVVGEDTAVAFLLALAGEVPSGALGEALVDWNAVLYDFGITTGAAQNLLRTSSPRYIFNDGEMDVYFQIGDPE